MTGTVLLSQNLHFVQILTGTVLMQIKKVNSISIILYENTEVKLKTAGNIREFKFSAEVNKKCSIQNISEDKYLDKVKRIRLTTYNNSLTQVTGTASLLTQVTGTVSFIIRDIKIFTKIIIYLVHNNAYIYLTASNH